MAKFKAGDKVVRTGPDTGWWYNFCDTTGCDQKQVFVVADTSPHIFVGYESFTFDDQYYDFAPSEPEQKYTVEQVIRAYGECYGLPASGNWTQLTISEISKRLELNEIKESTDYKQYLELKEKFKDIV